MLLRKKVEIKTWLALNSIKNYELIPDNKYGYVVNVNGHVDLSDNDLLSINVKFNIVNGFFDCSNNKLESLEGCPKKVKDFFSCSYNNLINLIGCPKRIDGGFFSGNNQLETLKYFPKKIGKSINLQNNNIKIKDLLQINDILNDETKSIYLSGNKKLGELQNINDFNEIKKILTIYQEKTDLMKILEVTDKSVEKLDNLLINNKENNKSIKSTNLVSTIEKINKI